MTEPETSAPARGEDTRRRLLEAAAREFAERGFRGATVRAIADRAEANLNAINYHFRSKEELYGAVLADMLASGPGGSPPPRLAADPDDPEGRLRAFLDWYVARLLVDPGGLGIDKLLLHEISDPTPVLDHMVERGMRPVYGALREIVARLLPAGAPEAERRRACLSILAQCNIYRHGWPMLQRLLPELRLDQAEVHAIAGHVAAFSLAGLRAQRERLGGEA